MSTESVVELNCGSNDTLNNTRKKATRGSRAIQGFYMHRQSTAIWSKVKWPLFYEYSTGNKV